MTLLVSGTVVSMVKPYLKNAPLVLAGAYYYKERTTLNIVVVITQNIWAARRIEKRTIYGPLFVRAARLLVVDVIALFAHYRLTFHTKQWKASTTVEI